MSSIRLDRVVFSTLHEAYQNYGTGSDDIVVAATPLADGSSRTISVVIPYERGGTRADIYATRGSVRTLVSTGGRAAASAVYNFKSTEIVRFDTTYGASSITVALVITNDTGSSVTPNAQTITIDVVKYDAPISSI